MPHSYSRITAVFASPEHARYAISLLDQLPEFCVTRLREDAALGILEVDVESGHQERALTLLKGAHGIPTVITQPVGQRGPADPALARVVA
jgi:hypothetical protein